MVNNRRILCEREIPYYIGLDKEIALKGRTREYVGRIRFLSDKDIDQIMDLEEKTNIPDIQATADKIRKRFEYQNQMLGFEIDDGTLIASVAWKFDNFSPEEIEEFPTNFEEYSTPNSYPPHNFNAMFHYGININPKMRDRKGEGLARRICKDIFDTMFNQGRFSGCEYFVSDPRLHTYNGSKEYPDIEFFEQDPRMREAVDKAIAGEKEFTMGDALLDPAFKVYGVLAGGVEFLKLMPNTWFPPDKPSGGYGIIVYKKL